MKIESFGKKLVRSSNFILAEMHQLLVKGSVPMGSRRLNDILLINDGLLSRWPDECTKTDGCNQYCIFSESVFTASTNRL